MTEEQRDRRLAFIVVEVVFLIGFFFGLFVGKAWACDSYEDCMNQQRNQAFAGPNGPPAISAIAYKLDEISKKMDYSDEERSNKRQAKEFKDGMTIYWKENAERYLSKKDYKITENDLGNVQHFVPEYYDRVKENCKIVDIKDL